jgi:hypothetical protein
MPYNADMRHWVNQGRTPTASTALTLEAATRALVLTILRYLDGR